jgi:hypothetical protein
MAFLVAAILIALAALPCRVEAQDTRAELLEQQRAEKARALKPYEPGKLETFVKNAEEGKLRRLISPHNGFFAEYGYTYKPVGSGIGFGGGFRHDLFERRARVELEAGASFRKYRMLRADFALPRLAGERLELGVEATSKRHPQEDFYGPGIGSIEDDRVSFLYKGTDLQGRAIVTPRPWLRVGGRIGHLAPAVGEGTDTRFPSIEARFDDRAAPGLLLQPDFSYGEGFAEVDFRDEPGNARAWAGPALDSWLRPCPLFLFSFIFHLKTERKSNYLGIQKTLEIYETWPIKSTAIFGSATKSLGTIGVQVYFSQLI